MGKLFDVSLVFSSIPELLTKLPITLELAVVSMLIGLALGLLMAIIKMKPKPKPMIGDNAMGNTTFSASDAH